jgi:lipopolysaccharide/colanic/teichoic acid biosynthesis glycosyltransferase
MHMTVIRLFDILISFCLLVVLSPFLIVVSLCLLLSGNPVFFRQERVGKDRKLFHLIKFTTMKKEAEFIALNDVSFRNDDRYIRTGRFLNKIKLNEIPQLINILSGDMSFIGPRPMTEETFLNFYTPEAQEIIAHIHPGLSGLGSIFFSRELDLRRKTTVSNEEFARIYLFPYKSALEVWYSSHRTLPNYFKLIVLTLISILFPKNRLLFRVIRDLPLPPDELSRLINS